MKKTIKTKTPIKVIKPTKLDKAIMELSNIEVKNKYNFRVARHNLYMLNEIKKLLKTSPNKKHYKYTYQVLDNNINILNTKISFYRNRA